jgi:hypothetical protein
MLQQYATDQRREPSGTSTPRPCLLLRRAPARVVLPNSQSFDFAGLRGRLLSSSYAPAADDPRHEPMLAALKQLFDEHATAGPSAEKVARFDYDTEIYYGRLTGMLL